MINSELLKEAIADAKAVRATALANAKAALEEAFAPRFEAMFADKLKEESQEEEQEEAMAEVSAPTQVHGSGGEAKGPATKDVSKGQPKKGSAAKKDFKTIAVGGSEGAAGSKAPAAKQSIVTEKEEEDDDKEKVDEQEAVQAEAGLTSEDLDEIIKELEAEVAQDAEGEKPVDMPAPAPEAPVGDEIPSPEIPGEEGEPAPEGEPDGDEVPDEEPAPEGEPDGDEMPDMTGEEPAPEVPGMPGEEPAPAPQFPPQAGGEDEEINLDELLAALNEEADEEEEGKEMNETEDGMPTTGQCNKATVKGYPKTGPEKTSPGSGQVTGKNHNISGKGNIGSGTVGGLTKENTELKKHIAEYDRTLTFVKGQLNEVNLLNAKLLYTNKLFKEFAGVLTDPYRMKIVEAFDLTKSVREVKLAYALLAESLNFGTRSAQKPAVKKTSNAVRQITEGFASKPVASTKPSKGILSEGAVEMATRFQKLAGIKRPV